ncbi:MAG: spore photoproduct lyase family protein [Candidatus Hydrothermales bacterium]
MKYLNFFDPFKSKTFCTCERKYTINPYTGCSHKCSYCYITSYIKDGFQIRFKKNFIEKLKKDIEKIKEKYPVNLSSSSDPYPKIESFMFLTRRTLLLLKENNFKISIITKSPLVLRDIDIIKEVNATVSFTITHYSDEIASKVEINAPPVRERIEAAKKLLKEKVKVCVRIDPIIPLYNDKREVIRNILKNLEGIFMVVFSTYKAKPDNFLRIKKTFPYIENLPWEKKVLRGYRYLSYDYRRELLEEFVEEARNYTEKIGLCREGIDNLKNTVSCDPVFEVNFS